MSSKKAAVLSAVMLVFVLLLAGCGNHSGSQPETEPEKKEEPAPKAVDPETSDPVSVCFVSVPEEAFGTENARVIAASRDGGNILISSAFELYVWDVAGGKRLPVYFSREANIERLNGYVETGVVMQRAYGGKPSEEQMNQRREDAVKAKAAFLEPLGLSQFVSLDQVAECYPQMIPYGARCTSVGDDYAIAGLYELGIGDILVNLRTGEAVSYSTESTENSAFFPVALCGNLLLGGELSEKSPEMITDLDTGEKRTKVTELSPIEDNPGFLLSFSAIRNPVLTPDGLVLALTQKLEKADDEYVTKWGLIIIGPERSRVVLLETLRYSSGKKLLVTTDGKYAMVSDSAAYESAPVIVRLDTDEIRTPEAGGFTWFGSCGTGFIGCEPKTMIPVLLHADTLEIAPLRLNGVQSGNLIYSAILNMVGNGHGMFFSQNDAVHGYLQLQWE